MKKFKFNEKNFLIIFIALIIISTFYLFLYEAYNRDYDYKKNWSALYFVNAKSDSLDFMIENYEGKEVTYNFIYKNNNEEILKKEITLKEEDKKKVKLDEKYKNGEIILEYGEKRKVIRK